MNLARLDIAKTLIAVVGLVFAGRTAMQRAQQARSDDDRLEMFDAALNAAVVITGLLVIIRRLRRGEADE